MTRTRSFHPVRVRRHVGPLLLAFSLIGAPAADAAVTAYDPFLFGTEDVNNGVYPINTSITGKTQNGGPIVGFSSANAWVGIAGTGTTATNTYVARDADATDNSASASTLTSAAAITPQGGAVQYHGIDDATVRIADRQIDAYTPAGTYYMSGLFRAQDAIDLDGYAVMGFTNNLNGTNIFDNAASDSAIRGYLWGFKGDGAQTDIIVRHRSATNSAVDTVLLNGASFDTTYFMVIEVNINVSGFNESVTAQLYDEAGTLLASATFASRSMASTADITHLTLAARDWGSSSTTHDGATIAASTLTHGVFFDEPRFGTTLNDVRFIAAVPTPAALPASLGLIAMLTIRRRRTR